MHSFGSDVRQRVLERHTDCSGRPAENLVGQAQDDVLLVQNQRDSQTPCGQTDGEAHVATHTNDHVGTYGCKQATCCEGRTAGAKAYERQRPGPSAIESLYLEEVEVEAGLRHEPGLGSGRRSHERHALAQLLSESQSGVDVTRGATTRDHNPHPFVRAAFLRWRFPCRAMLVKIPIAARPITSDVPPNETKGNGTPVTGRAAVTAPILTSAWNAIHTVIPAAMSIPNRSRARRAIFTPRNARNANMPRTVSVPSKPISSPKMA